MCVCVCVKEGEERGGDVSKVLLVCFSLSLSECVCVCLEVVDGGSGCVIYGNGKTQSVILGGCSS